MANCTLVESGTTGREVCDLLDGAGNGLGLFVEAIKSPLTGFIFVLALIAATVAVVVAVAGLVRSALNKRGMTSGRS